MSRSRAARAFLVATLAFSGANIASAQPVTRLSVSTGGAQGNAASAGPSISANGRWVAFISYATNLVANDTNGATDVFVRDRDTDADGAFDEPGAVSTERASLTAGGQQVNGDCFRSRISDDGRYVFFTSLATNIVPGLATATMQLYRFDRERSETILVTRNPAGQPADSATLEFDISADGRYVVFFSLASNLVAEHAGSIGGAYLWDMATGGTVLLSRPRQSAPPVQYGVTWPSISRDGSTIAFAETQSRAAAQGGLDIVGRVTLVDRASGVARRDIARARDVRLGADGRTMFLLADGVVPVWYEPTPLGVADTTTLDQTPAALRGQIIGAVSNDSRYVLLTSTQFNVFPGFFDARRRMALEAPYALFTNSYSGLFSDSARWLTFGSNVPTVVANDTNDAMDVFVADLDAVFDRDGDTLDDRDETFYGLSPTVATGDDGPGGDPDADGATNAAEIAAGTHPRGFVKRYLAEGATSDFFRTRVALANPDLDATHPAGAVLSLLREGGSVLHLPVRVEAGSRQTVDVATAAGVDVGAFSTVIESDRLIGIDRTMSWDTRPASASVGYGAHTESAAMAPSSEWYLAEGATGVFDLYYLLQNPQSAPVDVTVRYLLPDAAPIVRTYPLPANSRTTIHVNDVDPVLAISEVSGAFSATAPILVERAMYASRPGQPFAIGHAAKGVPAGATSWFLAEGATGTFFDTYVLIANPTSTPATIEARFDTPDSGSVTRSYTLAANSRFTVLLDAIPGLEATSVSTTITSTNTVPVIVERAMYWPDGFANYYEGHVSAGVTTPALRWIIAEGEEGGPGEGQTYVLIANPGTTAGRVRVTPLFSVGPGSPIEIDLQPHSRTTVRPGTQAGSATFATLVESIGPTPAPIVVEGAFYWTVDGVTWAAGSGVVATRLP